MKKLGKKLSLTNETLKAYCGCACTAICVAKCNCQPSTVAYASLNSTSSNNLNSTTGVAAK